MFEKFSRPYEERLVKELAAEEIFTAIHICGDTMRIVDSLAGYDFCGFELDYKTDMALAKKTAGARHVLSRTLIPVENGVSVQILTEFTSVLSLQHATEPAYRISRRLLPRDGAWQPT